MDILSVESTPEYLVDQQVIAHSDEVLVTQLMGGVSNYVLLVEFLDTQRQNWVLKQARDRLAVEQEWRKLWLSLRRGGAKLTVQKSPINDSFGTQTKSPSFTR